MICHIAAPRERIRREQKNGNVPPYMPSHPLLILMLDIDISFMPPLTDGSPLVDGIPSFLMIRNFPQEAATYPVSPDASDLIDFLSRWWKYLLSILAIRLERRPTLFYLSRPHL